MTRTSRSRPAAALTPRLSARRARRGIAMLLVLVALVVTVVLVGATLSSRENAPAIGANAGGAAEAR